MRQFNLTYVFTLALLCSAPAIANDAAVDAKANDGIYHTQTTETVEACAKLCNEDKDNICRGYSFYQPDDRYSKGECQLNNGIGKASDFEVKRPESIDIETVLSDMNHYRAEYDLPPLVWNDQLAVAADVHSKDLAAHGILQHEGTDGSSAADRVTRAGYTYRLTLENVAAGQKSWASALQGWKDSKGHNENLLHEDATEIGVALDFNPHTRFASYWTMVLGKPLDIDHLTR